MSKKGENIYKRKDGRWEGRYIRCYTDTNKASEILGHANVNITLNRYVHSSFEPKQMNMNKLLLL